MNFKKNDSGPIFVLFEKKSGSNHFKLIVLQKLFEFIRAESTNERNEDAFLMSVVYCCL